MWCAVLLRNQCEGGRCHLSRCVGLVILDHFHTRMSYAHADSHQYTCADCYLHPDADGHTDTNLDSHTCANLDAEADGYTDTNLDSHAYANPNTDSHQYTDANSDAYSYSYTYTDSHQYTYTDCNSYTNPYGNRNAYSYADTNGHIYVHSSSSSTLPPSGPHREIRNRKYAGYPHAYADRPYADSHTIWIPNCHPQPCCRYSRSHSHCRFRLEQRSGHTLPERVVLRQLRNPAS